jgi:transposase-like protein
MAKKITKDDLQNHINKLSMSEILSILDTYSKANSEDISTARNRLITDDLQVRLEANGINTSCPYCHGNNISKYGSNGNIKRFKCKDCGKTFTLFTGTILEKTKYPWEIWVEMVYYALNDFPMEAIKENLKDDFHLLGIDRKTIFHWIHKIIHALAEMPMPTLSGVVQVDETFFRENQKGSQHLLSTVQGEERTARVGRKPSKYGVMGNEFANVVCMVDLTIQYFHIFHT